MSRIPIKFEYGLNHVVYVNDNGVNNNEVVPDNAILYNNDTPMGTLEEIKKNTSPGQTGIYNASGVFQGHVGNLKNITASTPHNTIPQGGKRKSRRNTKRKKSRKGKSRKNLRKSNRRR